MDAARAGQKTEARDLLLRVVEIEPRNDNSLDVANRPGG